MGSMYGSAWVSQYGPAPDGVSADTWATVLAGISPRQLAHGLREAVALGRDFPPSAPRFRGMCLNIPSFAQIQREFLKAMRTPFGRLVWSHIDGYRFRSADQRTADTMLRDAYELAKDHVMRGGELPPEPVGNLAAPAELGTPATEQTARKALDDLAKLFGSEP